jgi:hypothetical protein
MLHAYSLFSENLHSKRINSGDSHEHPVTENNQHHQNDDHSKKLNKKTVSFSEQPMMVENIHTIPDTADNLMMENINHSTKEPTSLGEINK